jgi:hypothetical protein
MASVGDVFFLIQFIAFLAIIMAKFINVLSGGKLYQVTDEGYNGIYAFVFFIGGLITWAIGFVTLLVDPTILTLSLFRLETWLLPLHFVFLIIELIYVFNGGLILKGGMRKAAGSGKK